MPRSFVAFDDSYRVPVPVNVSRAVSCGGTVHICGQLHTDGTGRVQVPGNLVGQTEGAMRRLYEVFGHAGLDGADMAQLQPGPASTGIVVPRLEIPGAMIQAGCVAVSG